MGPRSRASPGGDRAKSSPHSSLEPARLQHHPVFSLGKRGVEQDLRASDAALKDKGFDVCETNRGGQVSVPPLRPPRRPGPRRPAPHEPPPLPRRPRTTAPGRSSCTPS